MRIARFFATGQDLEHLRHLAEKGETEPGLSLDLAEDDLIKQIHSVLRLGKQDRFCLLDGSGTSYELSIVEQDRKLLRCRIESRNKAETKGKCRILAGVSLIKSERFEWCIEKLTELGVSEIIPLHCRHTVVRFDSKDRQSRIENRLKRWQSIAREASEQSERVTIPQVVPPEELSDFLRSDKVSACKALRLICAERKPNAPRVKALEEEICGTNPKGRKQIDTVVLLVGPEGGFAADEITSACNQGWKPVSLGPRILRSETAAIVVMSQVASLLDI